MCWTSIRLGDGRCTWIGLSNCVSYVVWSIGLRIFDRYNIQPMKLKPTRLDDPDAAIFLGRRHSGFVLEGSRKDIFPWTETGLDVRECSLSHWAAMTARLGSGLLLVWIFVTIPNGTMLDQVVFILVCMLAQFNVIVGQRINATLCLSAFEKVLEEKTVTRTHVYASLIKRYKNGVWVDATQLLPQTELWARWRAEIMQFDGDPKNLYNLLANGKTLNTDKNGASDTIVGTQPS